MTGVLLCIIHCKTPKLAFKTLSQAKIQDAVTPIDLAKGIVILKRTIAS